MAAAREFDVVVLGASGSVGNVIARYFAEKTDAATIKWAVAGRADSAVARQPDSAVGKPPSLIRRRTTSSLLVELGTTVNRPALIAADARDADSMLAMAKRTRVLVTTVGPYVVNGEAAVRACVAAGTHYVDITGETFWVTQMRDKYGAEAIANGCCIVSFAGYDCVPFELSAFLAQRTLAASHATTLASAECLVSMSGGLPRGTILTVVGIPAALARQPLAWLRYMQSDEWLPFARDALIWLLPWWSSQTHGLTVPDGMGLVAATIVHAAAPALGFAKLRFTARSDIDGMAAAMLPPVLAKIVRLLSLLSLPAIGFYAISVLCLPLMAIALPILLLPATRNVLLDLISKYLYYPGDAKARTLVRTRGTGANGATVYTTVDLPGDPGIYTTALCAAETALALLECAKGAESSGAGGADGFRPPLPTGFVTPLVACGETLAARIEKAEGVRIECRAK